MAEPLRFDPRLSRPVRAGALRDQRASTYRLAADALAGGRFEEARDLGRVAIEEAREGRELFPRFAERARSFLLAEGVDRSVLEREEERLVELLRFPDGTPFDLDRGWSGFASAIEDLASACEQRDAPGALAALERAREAWRRTHDRACDLVCGLLDVCARLLGEERIGEAWDHLLEDLYPGRDRYDVDRIEWRDAVEALVLDAATSLRGHLSGPGRAGEVEIEEERDRWVLRFDPCGSGGRTYRPDAEEGTPPRAEAPYGFAVTTGKHDWAWNTEGVCLYCVHCCQLQEREPIRRFGYPVRVVDPPVWPDGAAQKCTWYVYKDPSLVPDDAYRRVGAERPPRLGGSAVRGDPPTDPSGAGSRRRRRPRGTTGDRSTRGAG